MANQEQLDILKQGVEVWNQWREEHPDLPSHESPIVIALFREHPSKVDLTGVDLSMSDLRRIDFSETDLSHANLGEANLSEAQLRWARLEKATLSMV